MKRVEINLAGPFGEVLENLLALQCNDSKGEEIRPPGNAESRLRNNGNGGAEVEEALRCLHEAANGRQVETQIGLIPIAPPVAAFLTDQPFHVATQDEFFIEAFARILSAASAPRENRTYGARSRGSKLPGSPRRHKQHAILREEQNERQCSSQRRPRGQPSDESRGN